MELIILDKNFEIKGFIDSFVSVIWTERYDECGDFELYTTADKKVLDLVKMGDYVCWSERLELMIVEKIVIEHDSEDGDRLNISGRSLPSILDRRIIWNQKTFKDSTVTNVMETLINESIIAPTDSKRKISNYRWVPPTDLNDSSKVTIQFCGENLYEVIEELCKSNNIGFRSWVEDGNFNFQLYSGKDRSWEQTTNNYVIFSDSYNNISETQFINMTEELKNCVLVGGRGEGTDQIFESYGESDDVIGLDRREMYEKSSTSDRYYDDSGASKTMSAQEYKKALQEDGKNALKEKQLTKGFDCEFELLNTQFIFETDYFMGDIVQVSDQYGNEDRVRLIEVVFSQDSSGYKMTPSFRSVIYDEENKE